MPGRDPRPIYAWRGASRSWEIDLARRELRARGTPVPLGSRAFEILELLVQSSGELVSKGSLIDRVWQRANVEENTLQFHISAIRKALGSDRETLKTVSGRGYRLVGDWTIQQPVREGLSPPSRMTPPVAQPTQNNLPAAASGLIGRSAAMRDIRDLLSAYRLVTLTGPGGIGKSKLALEVARELCASFEGDIFWVELVSSPTADLVPSAIAGTLGLKLGGDQISSETVARSIGERKLLLVLDNCEHVIDAAARLTEALVTQCARTSVLATSREPLRIDGEHIYRVPPLDVPPREQKRPDGFLGYSAVQLFVARMSALDCNFTPSGECLAIVAAICRRLDGIPLAIEFAAARAAVLGVQEVASRLDDRFALLTSGRRTALPRHQTLRASLDLSYELLSAPERRLLRRLAVFPAGFTLDAAAAVVSDVDTAPSAVVEDVASLVAKSLVTFDGSTRGARWRLLETIRAYALEKLAESGEAERSARLHAEFFRNLLGSSPVLQKPEPAIQVMALGIREINNIRAALDWAFSANGDVAIGAVLTAACAPVWLHLSLIAECRERCERALRHFEPHSDIDLRVRMQLALALGLALSHARGSVDDAWIALSDACEIAEKMNDTDMQLKALWGMWSYRLNRSEHRITRNLAERFSQVAGRGGNLDDVLVGDRLLGTTLHYEGRQREARSYIERFLTHYVGEGNERHRMWMNSDQRFIARCYLARTLLLQGLADQARRHARTAFEEARLAGDLPLCFYFAEVGAPIAIMTGDLDAAAHSVTALIELSTKQGATFWTSSGPCLQAVLLIRRGEFAKGATLLSNSLKTFRATGNTVYYLALLGSLAEGLAGAGLLSEAQSANDEALAESKRDGQGWYLPELLRIRGELLLREMRTQSTAPAENCFLEGIETARQQGALFWELRVALSLTQLRLKQDRADEARHILAPIYGQFTEGFETADLCAARALLESLGAHRSDVDR